MTWLSFVDADGEGSGVATLASRNLYGAAVDQIFATEVASGDVLWALSDHQSTVRDWATFDDAANTTSIAAHVRYSSFGSIEFVLRRHRLCGRCRFRFGSDSMSPGLTHSARRRCQG